MKANVAYTEYTFANYEAIFTDQGNVNGLVPSVNYNYTSVLPMNGNANLNSNASYTDLSDSYINVLVQYNKYANLSGDVNNVHQLTTYNYQYRYFISGNISRTGMPDLENKTSIEGNTNIVGNLMRNNGSIDGNTKGNLELGYFSVFTYTDVNRLSPRDTFFPFYSAEDCAYQTNSNINNNVNYLFPGFTYTTVAGTCTNYFYGYKNDGEVDFVIENNSDTAQDISLKICGVDQNANTIKAAIINPSAPSTTNGTKPIPIRKIRLGRADGTNIASNWYSYVVCKIYNEVNSYVVVLYRLDSTGTTLPAELLTYTPVTCPITAIEKK